jgi:chromosomal replication initiation ATPase DnaA
VLGSESFARRVQDRVSQTPAGFSAQKEGQVGSERLKPEIVLQAVSKRYRLPVARLREKAGYGLEARNVALWLIWERCGLSQKEIGVLFGGMNGAAVAQRLRRLKEESREQAQALGDEMSNV